MANYAYDLQGKKVNVTIKDGKSYLDNGSRVGTGYTVETGGGVYKMGADGKGVKVDSHNSAPVAPVVSTSRVTTRDKSGKDVSGYTQIEAKGTTSTYKPAGGMQIYNGDAYDSSPVGSAKKLDSEFKAKYSSIIDKLASTGRNVTTDVAKDMLISNIEESLKGNAAVYTGGGKISSSEWSKLVEDYKTMKTAAINETKDRNFTDSMGRSISGKDLLSGGTNVDSTLGQNLSGKAQEELGNEYNQMYGDAGGGAYGGAGGLTEGTEGVGGVGGMDAGLGGVADFYKNSSSDFLKAQSANLQSQMEQQITELEQAYAQAISEGKISVRDAEQEFAAQKSEIEQKAYQQAEATKGYGSEMGIANSQQMMGLQKGDNSRINTINNANASDRDNRIADIRDRINSLSLQKNLGVTNAKNQYNIGLQGATAQASQMYNQSMGGMMEKNYFSDKEFGQENQLADKKFGQQLDLAALGQKYNIENMDQEQIYALAKIDKEITARVSEATVAFDRDLDKMKFGSDLNIKEMAASISMGGSRSSGGSGGSSSSSNEKIVTEAVDEAREAMVMKAMSLGIGRIAILSSTNPYEMIANAARAQDIKYSEEDADNEWRNGIRIAVKDKAAQREIDAVFEGGDLIKPNKPKITTYSSLNGTPINSSSNSNYDKEMSAYDAKMKAQEDLLKKYN